jgi:hypothetical protein
MINESLMSLKYKAEKGALVVGADKSNTQCRMLDIVPELVAWDAVIGNRRCRPLWFATVIFVAAENDGFRIPGPSCMPSATTSSMWSETSCCFFSATGKESFRGGGLTFDPSEEGVGPEFACGLADCPILDADTAGVFLRNLNENFLGGLKVLRVF